MNGEQRRFESRCPWCNGESPITAALGTRPGRDPRPGELAVCFMCLNVSEFGADGAEMRVDETTLSAERAAAVARARAGMRFARRLWLTPRLPGKRQCVACGAAMLSQSWIGASDLVLHTCACGREEWFRGGVPLTGGM